MPPATTSGVLYEARPLPRSAFQRSLPVFLSSASRYERDGWSQSRISRSPCSTGELPCPHWMSNAPFSRGELPLPHDGAGAIERDDLAGAEPREHQRAVGHRARRGEVVLVVDRRQIAGRFDAAFPHALAVGAIERLDDEDGLRRVRRRRGAERPFALRRGVGALHQPRMVAFAPDAGADLRRRRRRDRR